MNLRSGARHPLAGPAAGGEREQMQRHMRLSCKCVMILVYAELFQMKMDVFSQCCSGEYCTDVLHLVCVILDH